MSESNWRRSYTIGLTAVGLAASCFAGWLWLSTENAQLVIEQQATEGAQTYADPRNIAVEGKCLTLPQASRTDCITNEREASYEGQRKERDLEAQRVVATWTRAVGIATIVGMTFGIFGLSLIFVTFRETRRAADAGLQANRIAMKADARATRRAIASAKETAAALEYAQRSAATAEDALQEARQANISQLRPFLVVTGVNIRDDLTEADAMSAEVIYENAGQSPALKASGENQFGFASNIEPLIALPPVPEMPGGSKYTVAPGKPHRFVTKCPGLNPRIYATVRAGGAILFARGWIRYTDIFGNTYQTDYLYALTEEGFANGRAFQAAPFGNEMT